jgi:hypothetical protein
MTTPTTHTTSIRSTTTEAATKIAISLTCAKSTPAAGAKRSPMSVSRRAINVAKNAGFASGAQTRMSSPLQASFEYWLRAACRANEPELSFATALSTSRVRF